jgi:hypothetical protein
MFKFVLSVIEAIYIIYMLNFYKSKTNYADPNVTFSNSFLAHPKTHSDIPISMVCPAGNTMSWLFATYLIGREYAPQNKLEEIMILKVLNIGVMLFGLLMSLMNLNVILYLSPIFAIELIRLLI